MNAQLTRPFVGIDTNSRTDPENMPDPFRDALKMMDGGQTKRATTLRDVIRALPKATATPVFYWDEERGDYVEIERNAAVVNPAWLGDGLEDSPQESAAWNVPTRSYDVVTPTEAFGPLLATARQKLNEREDAGKYEAPDVFGMAREYKNGGEVHIDVFFPSYSVAMPDGSDDGDGESSDTSFCMGITTGKDYFRNQTLYATPIAFDMDTGATMRHLDEARRRRHRKSADEESGDSASETAIWYSEIIDSLDTVSETLFRVISESQQYKIPFGDLPYSPIEFYEANGIPNSVASDAVDSDRLPDGRRSTANATLSAWELYRALSVTLADGFTSKTDGQAIRGHVATANEILSTPGVAENNALDAARAGLAEQSRLEAKKTRETLNDRRETTREAVEEYGSIQNRLRDMFQEASENSDDGEADESSGDESSDENGSGNEVIA